MKFCYLLRCDRHRHGLVDTVDRWIRLPTEQAVRPRRTPRSRKAVRWAGIVFALRPAGGKLHGVRCGQGVGGMPVPACRPACLFCDNKHVACGHRGGAKRKSAINDTSCFLYSLGILYKIKNIILSQILEFCPASCYNKHGMI